MATKTSSDWHGCPIRFAAVVLGDPWALLILRDIMFKGRIYYADFLSAGEGISTNILATRLATLEAEAILDRTKDPKNGTRVIYSLTDKGLDLIPAMLSLMAWSQKWDATTEVSGAFADDLHQDPRGLAQRTRENLTDPRS